MANMTHMITAQKSQARHRYMYGDPSWQATAVAVTSSYFEVEPELEVKICMVPSGTASHGGPGVAQLQA